MPLPGAGDVDMQRVEAINLGAAQPYILLNISRCIE